MSMLDRVYGLETEYGLLINQDRPEQSPSWIAHQIRDHLFTVQRHGVLDLHHRGHDEPPGNGGFIRNGGRVYIDMGHLEYASPECGTLADLVAADRAGDQLLQQTLAALGLADRVALIKNNIDHETDATFGSHENYLVSRHFPFSRRGLGKLVPFLVTRQVFTGAGRVGAAETPETWVPFLSGSGGQLLVRDVRALPATETEVEFQLSQRADHIVNDFFEWVQQNRAIVNTRDEPLADPNHFRRIHLLLGDSNMLEWATALKLGTTGLVLQLIEDGQAPTGLELRDAVETLREVSRDPSRQWLVALASGRTISAIDIQTQYLEAAQRHYAGQDEEIDWVLAEWEAVLQDLRGDYTNLVGRVDWASKLWLLESFREAEGLSWNDPWLKSLDMEYHNLHPDRGLYFGLVQEGRAARLTPEALVELAMREPPRSTRAFGRGEVIRHLLESGVSLDRQPDERLFPSYVINWSAFQLRGRPVFPMPNPLKTYAQEVRQHLAGA